MPAEPVLLQIVGFAIFSANQTLIWGAVSTFIAEVFGFLNFGKLMGLVPILGAFLTPLQFFVIGLVVNQLDGNFSPVLCVLLGAASCSSFPLLPLLAPLTVDSSSDPLPDPEASQLQGSASSNTLGGGSQWPSAASLTQGQRSETGALLVYSDAIVCAVVCTVTCRIWRECLRLGPLTSPLVRRARYTSLHYRWNQSSEHQVRYNNCRNFSILDSTLLYWTLHHRLVISYL